MTDFSALLQPDRGQPAQTLHLVAKPAVGEWLAAQPERTRIAAAAQRFEGEAGEVAILPADRAQEWAAVTAVPAERGPWDLAAAAAKLPDGHYRLAGEPLGEGALGWLMAQHRLDAYRQEPRPAMRRTLLTAEAARIEPALRIAEASALVRDMVDTPAADMGPAALAQAVQAAGDATSARVRVTEGGPLAEGYPMIHAVGRAAARERGPRLIELEWGDPKHPRVALVGKGVCFDTGGLDIKPSAAMALMKKDMGGAAHALALARLVMAARLPVRLHLLIPAVENAVAADAMRPGDVLRSRKGLHVEIGNTDAEGRLILADALTRAAEDEPALILDFATLTGAARVALGPELPALFANDDALAEDLLAGGREAQDPLWRLPLWQPYAEMLKSEVADLGNAAAGGFAGAITAGLFLARFVPEGVAWAHVDTFAWNATARPGRPKGGEALGLRAAWAMLRGRFG